MFILLLFICLFKINAQHPDQNLAPEKPLIHYKATPKPDRIILTWSENDITTQTVTWRTDTSVQKPEAELVKINDTPKFYKNPTLFKAKSQMVEAIDEKAAYHSVTFRNLLPDTKYAYRVGGDNYWSEWIDFKTSSDQLNEPFEFIYFGDAQNDLFKTWSRIVRMAFSKIPEPDFALHVGDLINHSQNNYEWGEWFEAGKPYFRTIPQFVIPGNHEYIKNSEGEKENITPLWEPQFNYPKNSLESTENTAYYFDYHNCRLIGLNSNEKIDKQALWLEKILNENTRKWVIVFFHHPVISASKGRLNDGIMKQWKPILDKYKVDLVLQGHDHVYARGNNVSSGLNQWNEKSGTMYVVSVSGRKSYEITEQEWMQKKEDSVQLFQSIKINNDQLIFKAYKSNGELFDAFRLKKRKKRNNKLIELL